MALCILPRVKKASSLKTRISSFATTAEALKPSRASETLKAAPGIAAAPEPPQRDGWILEQYDQELEDQRRRGKAVAKANLARPGNPVADLLQFAEACVSCAFVLASGVVGVQIQIQFGKWGLP